MKNRRPDIYEMLDTSTLQDKIDLRDYLDTQIKADIIDPDPPVIQSFLQLKHLQLNAICLIQVLTCPCQHIPHAKLR